MRLSVLAAMAVAAAAPALAQPTDVPVPAAKTTEFPAGIGTAKAGEWQVYVDTQGRTLYGLDMRMVNRWTIDTSKYCAEADRCRDWEPLLAPTGSKPNLTMFRGFRRPAGAANAGTAPTRPATAASEEAERNRQLAAFFGQGGAPAGMYTQQNAPDWTIVEGPSGPQWVYKGYHMVYVRKGDRPRSATYEGADGRVWNTLKFVPPLPKLTAPRGVGAIFDKSGYGYLLTDKAGNLLYTGRCASPCSGWQPLGAGIASQGVGEWTVDRGGDRPQWRYRGKPVYVADDGELASLPRSTVALRP